jgi:C1A family cysteine protease
MCGSCWAFSAAEALEGQLGLNGAPENVSAQQLVDCVKLDFGCNGGWMDDALAYAEKHGVQNDTTYPYNATTQPCAADPSDATVRPTFYVEVPKSDVALREALVLFGPVSIALDATMAFQSYAGGVLTDDTCDPTTPDHALLLVGYNSVDGYWVIKNSWGPAWGRDGYVYMNSTIVDACGISSFAVVPYTRAPTAARRRERLRLHAEAVVAL